MNTRHNQYTAIVERDGKWYVATCPEVPEANGQGESEPAALENLSQAITMVLDERRRDAIAHAPADAHVATVCMA
ncbi:MAG: type II toxin-antitoxin system HicB family antitoxin [bacterium]|nr:type II toxin-antitoxin system HicB family antitoxin [bacterium]